jgi:hypothetical protein
VSHVQKRASPDLSSLLLCTAVLLVTACWCTGAGRLGAPVLEQQAVLTDGVRRTPLHPDSTYPDRRGVHSTTCLPG